MKRKVVYTVIYGKNLSKEEFTAWREAAVFIKRCLDRGHPVTGVNVTLHGSR